MISTLALDIENKGDCNTFHITDSSLYNSALPVTCGILEVTPPGKCASVFFEPLPGFHLILNASLLKIQLATNYQSLGALPDGVYYIKYSINPNDKLFVEYYYLHDQKQYNTYIQAACSLFHSKCDMTKKEYSEKVKELGTIKTLIDSTRYLAMNCNDPEGAKELYAEVSEQLKKFKTDGCTNCG